MATASLPHHAAPNLYHTDFDAFARALRAVAPEVQRTAAEYRTTFQAQGMQLNEQEALGYAVASLLRLAGPADEDDYYDRMADNADTLYNMDYNDDELLACGIDRS